MSLITSLFPVSTSGAGATAPTTRCWCRPTHRTNCFYVVGGNACCICVPSTATCFIIEMWGQGGGGAGSCCCMGACFGGQAGDYAWVAVSTSGTTHTLCACACTCNCCTTNAGLFTGSPGQAVYVCDCGVKLYSVAASACGGSTCCNGMTAMGSGTCGNTFEHNSSHSNLAINCCCFGIWTNNWGYDGPSYCSPQSGYQCWFSNYSMMPFQQIQGTSASGDTCNCCTCFNFYVRGGCGWSSPAQITVFASDQSCTYNQPLASYCGNMFGRGGSAYAGGAGQCCDCNMGCRQFGGMNGNAPGGGGSSASGTGTSGGCCLGSCGGLGLILISWS